jgi:penicillin-binding protein 2
MGDRIGWDRVAEYARKLGFASVTGIKLPDEKAGLIPSTEWKKKRTGDVWRTADNYMNSIGQGFVLVSPIQQSQMIAAIANGGRFYRPHILKKTRNRETGEVREFPAEPLRQTEFDEETLDLVRKALLGVTSEPKGTAHGAATPLAAVAGKTGTAQVISQKIAGMKLHGKSEDHAWFVAYAPFEDPKIAVAILVEHGGHGGAAAAPVAKKVIEAFMKNEESMKHAGPKTNL